MRKICALASIVFLIGIMTAAGEFRLEEKEEIQKTLKFKDPAKPRELQVDNIFGSINVEGTGGEEVKLVAHKTIRAQNSEKIQKAKEEVKLEISEEGNTIDLYVDGPFRCGEGRRWRSWRDPGYEVQFDFELKVPHKTSLFLKTVTNGDIKVNNVEGELVVKNVNGKIEMEEVSGPVEAYTVNGRVKALFSRNPQADCSFRTINGDLEISFCPDLSADLLLKTFNGQAYSDFPVTYLPAKQAVAERRQGKYVYKSNRFSSVRVGKGGPEMKFDTLNGDILINNRNK
jgi:hypothetical protein